MKNNIHLFTIVFFLVYPVYANSDWWSDRRDAVAKPTNKYLDEKSKAIHKKSKAGIKSTNEYIDEKTKAIHRKSKAGIKNANEYIDEKTKATHRKYKATQRNISNKYNASVRNLNRESSRRQKDFNAQINNIQNKSQASFNRIENQTTNSINDIRRGAQYESQKANQRIQASTRKLEEFKRNNPTNHRALSSAFEAAQQSVSTTSKKFGTSTKNAFSRLESSAAAKTIHRWGKRASTEKIVKGVNNTVDHIEHLESARELNRWGKRASMENVRKAVPNTVEYWESSDEGRALNNLGKHVSVENISKGVQNTKDYWESSETGKTLHEFGTRASMENIRKGRTSTFEYMESTQAGKTVKGLVAELKKTGVYKQLQNSLLSTVIAEPKNLELIEESKIYLDRGAHPVYYINGVMTDRRYAYLEAEFLARMIERPVYLLHNPSACGDSGFIGGASCVGDWGESFLDKSWPLKITAAMPVQHNNTTKQLAYILYYQPSPITIISHSQGTIITRNALMTVALLGKERKMRKGVAWTATGMPMQNSEVWPMPDDFLLHVNPNDPIAAVVGLRGGGHTMESLIALGVTHNPMCNYFPKIYNYNADPSDYRLAKGTYKAFYHGRKLLSQCHDFSKAGTYTANKRTSVDPESKMPYAISVDGYFNPSTMDRPETVSLN